MQGLAVGKKSAHLLERIEIKNEDGHMVSQWRKTESLLLSTVQKNRKESHLFRLWDRDLGSGFRGL